MGKHLVRINVNSEELETILEKLDEAHSMLLECVSDLSRLNVLDIDSEEAASGN